MIPSHPGEILVDELEFIGITASVLADKIDVPKNRMYQIINRQRSVTADTALRLAQFRHLSRFLDEFTKILRTGCRATEGEKKDRKYYPLCGSILANSHLPTYR